MVYAQCTDLRRRLSSLLDAVEAGDTVLLTRRGRPVARLVPVDEAMSRVPSWKRARKRFEIRGESIADTIRRDRNGE
jgi:prevent-host-death family protein